MRSRVKGLLVLCALWLAAGGCSREQAPQTVRDEYVFAPVKKACRLIERLENPTAVTNALAVRELDVRGMSADGFRRALVAMPGEDVHVWMPGATHWLMVGRLTTNLVQMADAMDVLALDEDCESVPQLFACYAGTREEILPAFESRLTGDVVPEWFVTKEIPAMPWLDWRGVEADIAKSMRAEMRSMQVVRRLVLEGNMQADKATDKKGEEKATEIWARAALRNPHDLMLLERMDRLERNASGFLAVGKVLQAMKCYETIVLIQPKDAKAVHNFGMCLKKIGKLDLAEKVLKRAESLSGTSR